MKSFPKSFLEFVLFSIPILILFILLIFPFFIFIFRDGGFAFPKDIDFFSVFFMTLFQAGSSTVLSVCLGLLGSLGLLSLVKKKYYFLIEAIVLIPALIPPLLLFLSVLHLIELFTPFPFGLIALIFTQTLTYIGVCSVSFSRAFIKCSALSEVAYLQGSSLFLFLKTMLQSLLKKDLKIFSALVFAGSFTNLSLPLLAGGSSFFSLEFFIYEKLKDFVLWPEAYSLIVFQSVFIFLICFRAFSHTSPRLLKISFNKFYLLPKRFYLIIPFMSVFFSIGGLFFISDKEAFLKVFSLGSLLFSAFKNSVILGLGTAGLTLLFLICVSFSFQNKKLRKALASFMPLGVSFMGFAFLIWPFYTEKVILLKWIFGLSLLLFPLIYRFQGERALDRLSSQVEIARFMGASWIFIFYKILWPQSRSLFFLCAGLAGFWACGDFAYSLIVSNGHSHLALLVYDLFSSYRLDEAILLSWLLLFVSFFVFLFWLGFAFVFDKKIVL